MWGEVLASTMSYDGLAAADYGDLPLSLSNYTSSTGKISGRHINNVLHPPGCIYKRIKLPSHGSKIPDENSKQWMAAGHFKEIFTTAQPVCMFHPFDRSLISVAFTAANHAIVRVKSTS